MSNNLSCDILQANLHKLSNRDQAFATDLIGAQTRQRNGLSANQQKWVNTLIDRCKEADSNAKKVANGGTVTTSNGREAVKVGTDESFSALLAIFDKATEFKGKVAVKNPKIKLTNAEGETLIIERCGNASKYTGQLNVKTPGSFEDCTWFGRIRRDGMFEKSPRASMSASMFALLQSFATNPAEGAKVYGQKYGVCCFCARELTTTESMAAGYGPDCAARYGLPWG